MQWYESLNDAARRGPGLAELEHGPTDIWYARSALIVTSQPIIIAAADPQGWRPRISELARTHVRLGSIVETDLERIFSLLQGECWSPHGEARMLIRRLSLDHTSMSIGDVVHVGLPRGSKGGGTLICRSVGWEQLES